jgi:hypothetical protein
LAAEWKEALGSLWGSGFVFSCSLFEKGEKNYKNMKVKKGSLIAEAEWIQDRGWYD